jgi:hypothetical protein
VFKNSAEENIWGTGRGIKMEKIIQKRNFIMYTLHLILYG